MFKVINMTKKTPWTHEGPQHTQYHFEFNFQGKEDYLEQKAGWRAEYKELSRRIRQYKLWRKPRHRPSDVTGDKVYSTLATMQEQARMMNQMIVQAKAQSFQEAQRQRKAA